ncbi:MAG: hypothetical protein J7L15_08260 [Clostridiales bacterium]|nr:hypothetical protein [Clostridiales bacterium]
MGTRNLTCVQQNNQLVVAKYCQWDGNPDGQGVTIVDFIKNLFDKDLFLEKLQGISKADEKYLQQVNKALGIKTEDGWITTEDSDKLKKAYPHLQRDMGGDILPYIQMRDKGVKLSLLNDADFALSSLFCEYAYVLNLDEDTLDFYTGFNKGKAEINIFYPTALDKYPCSDNGEQYFNVRKVASFSFADIKRLKIETIINRMKKAVDKEVEV